MYDWLLLLPLVLVLHGLRKLLSEGQSLVFHVCLSLKLPSANSCISKRCALLGTSKNQYALDHMLPQQIFLSLNLCIVQVLAHLFYFPSSEISFLIFLSQRLGL